MKPRCNIRDNILHLENICNSGTRSIQVYDIDIWYKVQISASPNSAYINLISINWSHNGETAQIGILEEYNRLILILLMQDIGIHDDRYPQTGKDRYPGEGGDRYPRKGRDRYPGEGGVKYPTEGKDRYPHRGNGVFNNEDMYI